MLTSTVTQQTSAFLHPLNLTPGRRKLFPSCRSLMTVHNVLISTNDWLTELRFYVPLDTKYVTSETSPGQSLGLVWKKLNLTQQKHTFTNQKKCTTTQINAKKLKPGLVASYDIQPGNGEGLFLFWCFINLSLTYLNTYPLTYSPQAVSRCK